MASKKNFTILQPVGRFDHSLRFLVLIIVKKNVEVYMRREEREREKGSLSFFLSYYKPKGEVREKKKLSHTRAEVGGVWVNRASGTTTTTTERPSAYRVEL